MSKKFIVELDEALCKGQTCAICQHTCPQGVFAVSDRATAQGVWPLRVAQPEACTGCRRCELFCPELAISVTPAGEQVVEPTAPQPAGPAVATPPLHPPQLLGGKRRGGGWTTAPGTLSPGVHFLSGNEACAEGALAAGCRFYGGYPITPSSEIMVRMARRLPEVGGTFAQMEDEIASLSAVIGASWAGIKSMTATSGPGFSLMMEGLGYAVMTETPCVIVNVQRAGPSTGQASRPAQGDVMQAHWGSHGGPEIIALAPWSVQEMYDLTIRAFNLAERFRVPVIVLADEVVGHLYETITVEPTVRCFNRVRWPQDSPFGTEADDGVPPMPAFGEGARLLVTGSTHDARGIRRTTDPRTQERLVRRLARKLLAHRDEIDDWEAYFTADAERLVVAYGSVARSALWAVQEARHQGRRVGLLRLKSLWPFPDDIVARYASSLTPPKVGGERGGEVVVPEMNLGQVAREVERCVTAPVTCLPQTNGELIDPRRILRYLLAGRWER